MLAHSRNPIEMIVWGYDMSLRQAAQAASMIAS